MKSAYISHLQWDSGGYADVHGVQSDGGLVFLKLINTLQNIENTNKLNPKQHDGATITLIGSGLEAYTAIRITNKVGNIHISGLAFTPSLDGTETLYVQNTIRARGITVFSDQGSGIGWS